MPRMFALYEALLYLVFFFALPWFLLVGFLRGKYLTNLGERLGRYSGKPCRTDLWIQAVSVGEVMVAKTLVQAILASKPDCAIVVTTTTIAGQTAARRLFPTHCVAYFPFDFSFAVRRFLDHYQPRAYVTVETEIWPNVVYRSSQRGIKIALVNGRLSDRSFSRYERLRALTRPVLARYDALLVREEMDRERFARIGARREDISIAGNIKFDFQPDETPLEIESRLRDIADGRKIFIAGSTVEGEDEMLLPILDRLIEAGYFVILAPRKPQRFEVVAGLLATSGLRYARRSELGDSSMVAADVLLLDTIGELARLYRIAECAFVGGSLVATGGHNPIEPAAVGTPVAFGPHMSNFREIAAAFRDAGAAREVPDPETLVEFAVEMGSNAATRAELSRRCIEVVDRNRGAARRCADRIVELLG